MNSNTIFASLLTLVLGVAIGLSIGYSWGYRDGKAVNSLQIGPDFRLEWKSNPQQK